MYPKFLHSTANFYYLVSDRSTFSRFSGIGTAKDHVIWCCMGAIHNILNTKQVRSVDLFLEAEFWMLVFAYARNGCDLTKKSIKNSVGELITPLVCVVAPCLSSSVFIEMYDDDSMIVYTIYIHYTYVVFSTMGVPFHSRLCTRYNCSKCYVLCVYV